MGGAGSVGVSFAAVVGMGLGEGGGGRGYVMSRMCDERGYLWGDNCLHSEKGHM